MKRAVILPPLKLSFDEVFEAISKQPKSQTPELLTTGHALFVAQAKNTRDGRRFISLPHSNRIYEDDWGYRTNGMGKDGQRIEPYAVSIDNWAKRL
ncbi:MAG: hypothetical protein HZB24_13655 [Desulfobacterales bacterium]|nr:hypothetical protein [Desulfobacterales bacterium]